MRSNEGTRRCGVHLRIRARLLTVIAVFTQNCVGSPQRIEDRHGVDFYRQVAQQSPQDDLDGFAPLGRRKPNVGLFAVEHHRMGGIE